MRGILLGYVTMACWLFLIGKITNSWFISLMFWPNNCMTFYETSLLDAAKSFFSGFVQKLLN